MRKKQKQHEFVIRVRFDRACSPATAIAAVRDTIHGNFYPYARDIDRDPEELWVKSFKPLPRTK